MNVGKRGGGEGEDARKRNGEECDEEKRQHCKKRKKMAVEKKEEGHQINERKRKIKRTK